MIAIIIWVVQRPLGLWVLSGGTSYVQ